MTNREEAWEIVNRYSAISAGYAFVTSPIPGTTLGVSAIQVKMVYDISKAYNFNLSPQEGLAVLGSLLSSGVAIRTLLAEAATETMTFIPGFGYLAKTAISGGFGYLLGKAAIEYFEKKCEVDGDVV